MALRDELIAAAERHCQAHGITKAALGEAVMKDNKFFARIEAGGGFTIRTFERFMAYFAANAGSDDERANPQGAAA